MKMVTHLMNRFSMKIVTEKNGVEMQLKDYFFRCNKKIH